MKTKKELLQILAHGLILKKIDFSSQTRKVIQIFFVAIFFINLTILSNSNEELFLKGNDYFFKGNFKKALDCYEQISEKSSTVWLNMGNCFFNEKKNVEAVICWKRAERNASIGQLGKLFELEDKAFEQLRCPCYKGFGRKFKQVLMGASVIQLQLILLMFLLLFLYFFYYCFTKSKFYFHTSLNKRIYMFVLILGTVCMILILNIKEKYSHKKEAIVLQEKVAVYIGPEITFSQKTILPLGCVVEVLEQKQNMLKIVSAQETGWILSDNVEIL